MGEKNNKKGKDGGPLWGKLWFHAALAAGGFLLFVVLAYFGLRVLTRHGQELEIPDLTNVDVSEARAIAGKAGLRVEVTDSIYIRRMGRGLVYSQNPKPGEQVKKGRKIRLTINSINPKKVQMPNLVGYSMRQAKAELGSRGLTLGKLIYVNDMATNNVLKQRLKNRDVAPGTLVETGTSIDLVLGLNSEQNRAFVPNTLGLKYLQAVDLIHDNSLNIRKLNFDKSVKTYSDSLDAVVVRQSPESSRAPVLIGSDVTLYLSADPAKNSH